MIDNPVMHGSDIQYELQSYGVSCIKEVQYPDPWVGN